MLLFKNLFGVTPAQSMTARMERAVPAILLGRFMGEWSALEAELLRLSERGRAAGLGEWGLRGAVTSELIKRGVINEDTAREILKLRDIRNRVVHGDEDYAALVTQPLVERLRRVREELQGIELP